MSVKALKSGAVEFLTKPFRDQDLLDAIQQALQRDVATREQHAEIRKLQERYHALTAREREVVGRIVNGEGTKHMAEAMNITPDTVRSYVKNILAKLGAHSRLQVAAIASRGKNPADGPAGPSAGQG